MLGAKVRDSFLYGGGGGANSPCLIGRVGIRLVQKLLDMHPLSCLNPWVSPDVVLLTCSCPDGDIAQNVH